MTETLVYKRNLSPFKELQFGQGSSTWWVKFVSVEERKYENRMRIRKKIESCIGTHNSG